MPVSAALAATLSKLEEARIATRAKVKICFAVIAVTASAVATYFYFSGNSFATIVSLVGGAVCAFGVASHLRGKIKTAFKNEVMPVLVSGIDSSLTYKSAQYIEENAFNESGLYREPDRYSGKDLVTGYIGETEVRFSLVHAEEEHESTRTGSDGKRETETNYSTIFQGLFFIADFNKHFSSRTLVRSGAAGFFSKLFGTDIKLEDPEFNSLFTVTSTDPVEARYILTPSLMERLKALHKKFGKFQTSFCSDRVVMAIDFSYGAFEPDISESFVDTSEVEKILSNLKAITGIVQDLDLNTRIWTKAGARPESSASV